MPWSLEQLRSYSLRAADGAIGQVRDVLFDDREWTVRYFVVDTGTWLPDRRVLISPSVVGTPDAVNEEFPVDLSREQVRTSPDIDTARPFSRQQEIELERHYGWLPYWGGLAVPTVGDTTDSTAETPPPPSQFPAGEPQQEDNDSPLRSGHEIKGYSIGARDGDIGSITDLVFGDEGWRIRWLVVDTGNWLPGRNVILSPEWVSDISWSEQRVTVDLTRDQVRDSPEFNPLEFLEQGYEGRLYAHYGRRPYRE